MLKRWGDEDENSCCLEEWRPALFVDFFPFINFGFSVACFLVGCGDFGFYSMQKRFGVQRCLGKESVGRRYAKDTANGRGCSKESNVPGKATWLFGPISIERTNYAADFMIEVEENCDDGSWYD